MSDLEDRLSDLCNRMEQMAAESSAGDVQDIAAMDHRIDALIRAVGDLAYLVWLRARAEQVSA